MKPGFTPEGLYNAADLVVMANDTLYQKFCFEQDERGKHRVVALRTMLGVISGNILSNQ